MGYPLAIYDLDRRCGFVRREESYRRNLRVFLFALVEYLQAIRMVRERPKSSLPAGFLRGPMLYVATTLLSPGRSRL
jgi:hypothetical protein